MISVKQQKAKQQCVGMTTDTTAHLTAFLNAVPNTYWRLLQRKGSMRSQLQSQQSGWSDLQERAGFVYMCSNKFTPLWYCCLNPSSFTHLVWCIIYHQNISLTWYFFFPSTWPSTTFVLPICKYCGTENRYSQSSQFQNCLFQPPT